MLGVSRSSLRRFPELRVRCAPRAAYSARVSATRCHQRTQATRGCAAVATFTAATTWKSGTSSPRPRTTHSKSRAYCPMSLARQRWWRVVRRVLAHTSLRRRALFLPRPHADCRGRVLRPVASVQGRGRGGAGRGGGRCGAECCYVWRRRRGGGQRPLGQCRSGVRGHEDRATSRAAERQTCV